jgi:hypothetical protein
VKERPDVCLRVARGAQSAVWRILRPIKVTFAGEADDRSVADVWHYHVIKGWVFDDFHQWRGTGETCPIAAPGGGVCGAPCQRVGPH